MATHQCSFVRCVYASGHSLKYQCFECKQVPNYERIYNIIRSKETANVIKSLARKLCCAYSLSNRFKQALKNLVCPSRYVTECQTDIMQLFVSTHNVWKPFPVAFTD